MKTLRAVTFTYKIIFWLASLSRHEIQFCLHVTKLNHVVVLEFSHEVLLFHALLTYVPNIDSNCICML